MSSTGSHESSRAPTESVSALPPGRRPTLLRIGTVVADRYEILVVLGKGGHGVVYRARDRRLKRDIALKVLRSDRLGEEAVVRFRREAQVARDVISPKLLRIFDIGGDGELTYLTMELVEGRSLKQRLAEGPLAVGEAARIASEVLRGLTYLHGRGIVHRDVKPGNVLIAEDGTVKLADFGLARYWQSDETRVTRSTAIIGTPEYLSPEQVLGQKAGPLSDLYSMGIVLFECLTGQRPHTARSSFGSLFARLHQHPPDVRKLCSEVPRWLAAVTTRLLEQEPGDRFVSAAAALAAFEARKAPWRLRRAGRRRLLWFAAFAVVATLVSLRWTQPRTEPAEPELRHVQLPDKTEVSEVRAVAADGQILWQRNTFSRATLARRLLGEPRRVMAFLSDAEHPSPGDRKTLFTLDLNSGAVLGRRKLESAPELFGLLGFSNAFNPDFTIVDLDKNGGDEVLIHFHHESQWPSYNVLYEPRLTRDRVVLVSSGFHRFAGAVDIDSDGPQELIFVGTNNRMGWVRGLAAVRLQPALGEKDGDTIGRARTPGDIYEAPTPDETNLLAWYCLLPSSACPRPSCVRIDPGRRLIEVDNSIGSDPYTVDFDGFRTDRAVEPTLPIQERQARRQVGYRGFSEARRLQNSLLFEKAGQQIQKVVQAATTADANLLALCAQRVEAEILVALGHVEEAHRKFLALMSAPEENPSHVAFDAATAFHVAGYLELALHWYREGYGVGASEAVSRSKWEYLQGLVLALGELDRWQEAKREVERFQSAYTAKRSPERCLAYVEWRQGRLGSLPDFEYPYSRIDMHRYWGLELRHNSAEPPESLLPDVELWLDRSSEETRALIESLAGELAVQLGQADQGLNRLRKALHQVHVDMKKFPASRAHYDWVTNRFVRVARAADHEMEAEEAQARYEQWKREQRKRYSWLPLALE